MKKQLLLFPLMIFFFTLLIFFYLLTAERDPSKLPSALIGKKVPAFETTSLFDNKTFISTKQFGGETTLVNFFATWCAPCRDEHRYIKSLSNEHGIKIIGINYKDDSEKTVKWLEELGNPYSNVIKDKNGLIGIEWGVYGIPETFIVDSKGIVKYRQVGPITKKIYDNFYSKIIESNKQ